MPLAMQAKLLRVLQEREIERLGSNRRVPVDLRIVVATNRNPQQAVQDGLLRENLFYRINIFTLEMPPLRKRSDDISMLVTHFLEQHGRKLGKGNMTVTDHALTCLQQYAWPGNIRELENVLESAVVLCRDEQIDTDHLPREILSLSAVALPHVTAQAATVPTLPHAVEDLEKELIARALSETNDNKSKAAHLLNISERSLWYKVKKYSV